MTMVSEREERFFYFSFHYSAFLFCTHILFIFATKLFQKYKIPTCFPLHLAYQKIPYVQRKNANLHFQKQVDVRFYSTRI